VQDRTDANEIRFVAGIFADDTDVVSRDIGGDE
jgi:hypothetical protein